VIAIVFSNCIVLLKSRWNWPYLTVAKQCSADFKEQDTIVIPDFSSADTG
jgi:hypothetical protein